MDKELLDHHLLSERYFFPRRGSFPDPFWVECDSARLACSYHETDPKAKTLVHFHGNGEIVDDWLGEFVSKVAQKGCNCFLAEYRGYGQSTGVPQLGKMLADVVPTVEAIGKPAAEMIFFGRSVGSIFAIEAAARFPQAAGLVLESGVADVLERLLLRIEPHEVGCTQAELTAVAGKYLDHQKKQAGYPGPVLVMHTEHDGLVDVSHGKRLYEWAAGEKRLKLFPHGNHNDIMFVNQREYFEILSDFIEGI